MQFFTTIASWFVPIAKTFPWLHPLTEPTTVAIICVVGVIAVIYYFGGWTGRGGRRRRYYDD